jgi:hypothetical protein
MKDFNKKGQGDLGIGIFFGILIGLGLSVFAGIIGFSIFDSSNDSNLIKEEAKYTLLDNGPFTGETSFISGMAKFDARLRNNEENQAATFKVVLSCSTNEKNPEIISKELWVQPNSVQKFEFEYNAGRSKEWKCALNYVKSGMISTCVPA